MSTDRTIDAVMRHLAQRGDPEALRLRRHHDGTWRAYAYADTSEPLPPSDRAPVGSGRRYFGAGDTPAAALAELARSLRNRKAPSP